MNVAVVVVASGILCRVGCLNKSLEKAPVWLPHRPNNGYNKHLPRLSFTTRVKHIPFGLFLN